MYGRHNSYNYDPEGPVFERLHRSKPQWGPKWEPPLSPDYTFKPALDTEAFFRSQHLMEFHEPVLDRLYNVDRMVHRLEML
jgi:hypothetical protein